MYLGGIRVGERRAELGLNLRLTARVASGSRKAGSRSAIGFSRSSPARDDEMLPCEVLWTDSTRDSGSGGS